jgi:hypothetical protein
MQTFNGLLQAFEETGGGMVSATIDGWEFILGMSNVAESFCLRATPAMLLANTDVVDRARRELGIPPDAEVYRFRGGITEILWSGDWPLSISTKIQDAAPRRRLTAPADDEEDAKVDDERTASSDAMDIVDRVLLLDKELGRAKALNAAWLRLYRARAAGDRFDERPADERPIEEDERLTDEYTAARKALSDLGVDLKTDEKA